MSFAIKYAGYEAEHRQEMQSHDAVTKKNQKKTQKTKRTISFSMVIKTSR